MDKHPCSTKIWNKFKPAERVLWDQLYGIFLRKELYPNIIQEKGFKSERETIAHNLACMAVWHMSSIVAIHEYPNED